MREPSQLRFLPNSRPAGRSASEPAMSVARLEGIVAKAGEEGVFVPFRHAPGTWDARDPVARDPDTWEAVFLGEGISEAARELAKGTLIDSFPETARDLPDQMDVVGADEGELGPAPGVVEDRITNTDGIVRPKRREAKSSILDLF